MSSCGCATDPCVCVGTIECEGDAPTTYCDLYDGGDNCWVVKGDPSATGICMLNTMSKAQVVYVLQRDEKARADLKKITTDPDLLHLADTVPRLPTVNQTDAQQALLNRNRDAASIPFYSIFRGKPPFAQ